MQNLLRSSLVAAVAVALAPLAAAQSPYPGAVVMRTSVLQHPLGNYLSGQATAAVSGQFSDDAIPDVAVLMGGNVQFVYAPDRRNSWLTVGGGGFTSIATRPQGFSSSIDDVLATHSTGLRRLRWSTLTVGGTLVEEAIAGTASFAGATRLQLVTEESGTLLVAALNAGHTSIVRARWNPSNGQWTSLNSISVAAGTTELVVLEWDGGEGLEYATASPSGLRLTDDDGVNAYVITANVLDNVLRRVETPGDTDRVAWARMPTASDTILSVVRDGMDQDSTSVFPGAVVHDMTTMDLDGDGLTELLLISDILPVAFGLTRGVVAGNEQTFNSFPSTAAMIVDLDRANSQVYPACEECSSGQGVYGPNMTPPVWSVADFDGDGDDDLFVTGHVGQGEANRAMVMLGAPSNEEALFHHATRTRAWLPQYDFVHSTAGVDFSFTHPIRPTLTSNPASAATHVRIVAWTQHENALELDRQAAAIVLCDLNEFPLQEMALHVPGANSLGEGGVIQLEISYLKYNGGTMVAAYPAYYETIPLWKFEVSPYAYHREDNFVQEIGSSSSGSTERPPISPPSSGGGGTTTP